jgi:hypothetical protein
VRLLPDVPGPGVQRLQVAVGIQRPKDEVDELGSCIADLMVLRSEERGG